MRLILKNTRNGLDKSPPSPPLSGKKDRRWFGLDRPVHVASVCDNVILLGIVCFVYINTF